MKTLLAALILLLPIHAFAGPLERPTGPVVLTISGNVVHTNADGVAEFDLAMLERLQQRSATMDTPWTEKSTAFEGPLLAAVLEAAGASGAMLKVTALNDYAAEVPIEDATTIETMLATRMNGEIMSVRDKGPLFLIYPFDNRPDLYNEKYFSRSVWQIKEIEVQD
jgi:hypothetical protein